MSLAAHIPYDPEQVRAELMRADIYAAKAFETRVKWLSTARRKQLPPVNDNWNVLFICAGRGFGKTVTGAQTMFWWAWTQPGTRGAVVAPTFGECRSVCFEGPTGLLSVIPEVLIADYNRTYLELRLVNGTIIKGFSAEKYDKLRGPNHHYVWADELGSWQYPDQALEQIDFGLRLGQYPHLIITTTPVPSEAIRKLVAESQNPARGVLLVTGSTYENKANLAQRFIEKMQEKYEGTRLGRQELHAEILADTPGALWTLKMLDETRVLQVPCKLKRIVVGVDPAMTATTESDETGIIVSGIGEDNHGYVLADRTATMAKPSEWAQAVMDAYHEFGANAVVAEVNNGGDLVLDLLNRTDAAVPVKTVHASVGKFARAEPISMLYEQKKAHNVGTLGKLESQMTTYVPGLAKKSPDRLDAMVWAMKFLMPNTAKRITPMPVTVMK